MTKIYDVIVVGAGMAGLKAAYDLQQHGKSVIVLEARDRIGGRIWTDRSFATIPIELGAELVHGSNAETWSLIRSSGLDTIELNQIRVRLKDGVWQPVQALMTDGDTFQLSDVPTDDESVTEYLSRLGISSEEMPLELRLLELDSESMNLWSAVEILSRAEDESGDLSDLQDYRILGGYEQIFHTLSEHLDIQLEQPVERVLWESSQVHVITQNGNEYSARQMILTLPLGVWKARQITFSPDLPPAKWSAVDALGVCDIVKLHFAFDKRVLDGDGIMSEGSMPPYWWNASRGYESFTGQVLVGWAAGEVARHFIRVGEAQAIAEALAGLQQVLQRPDITPTAARMMHWNNEPYTHGAYTFTPPGAQDARETLAAPLAQTLFFAGEATDNWHSSVQSAYRSGKRAALEILQSSQQ